MEVYLHNIWLSGAVFLFLGGFTCLLKNRICYFISRVITHLHPHHNCLTWVPLITVCVLYYSLLLMPLIVVAYGMSVRLSTVAIALLFVCLVSAWTACRPVIKWHYFTIELIKPESKHERLHKQGYRQAVIAETISSNLIFLTGLLMAIHFNSFLFSFAAVLAMTALLLTAMNLVISWINGKLNKKLIEIEAQAIADQEQEQGQSQTL